MSVGTKWVKNSSQSKLIARFAYYYLRQHIRYLHGKGLSAIEQERELELLIRGRGYGLNDVTVFKAVVLPKDRKMFVS